MSHTTQTRTPRIVVGITGATGAIYGIKLLERLKEQGVETHLLISRWGQYTVQHETEYSIKDVRALADQVHATNNLGATISSGSFQTDGMIVAPCSMRTLSAIAAGFTDDLIVRAADVTLKERRRLILMVRETPLHEIHLQNMLKVTQAGGIIFPPLPSFYTKLNSVDELVDYTVVRAMDLLGFSIEDSSRWDGIQKDDTR